MKQDKQLKSFLSTPSTLQFPSCNPCDPCIGHGATTSHCGWLSRNPTTTITTTGFHIPPHPPLHFLLPDHPCTLIHTRTCACVFCADTHKYACARATHTFVRTPYKTEQGPINPDYDRHSTKQYTHPPSNAVAPPMARSQPVHAALVLL